MNKDITKKRAHPIMALGLTVLLAGALVTAPNLAVADTSAETPTLRSYTDPANYAFQQIEDDPFAQENPPLKGSITSLKVTRGRSQIIKFAQPIVRLSIAEPSLAEVIPLAPDQIMINGKLRGVTSLIVWDENGQEGIFDLYIENDTSELMKAIEAIAPNEKIEARVTDDSFILSGQVSNSVILDEIRRTAAAFGYRNDGDGEKFIDLTETPVPQVVLEVKIVEASKSVARDLKTSFSLDAGNGLSLTRLGSPIDNTILGNLGAASPLGAFNNIPLVSQLARISNTVGNGSGLIPVRPIGVTQIADNVGGATGVIGSPNDPFQFAWDALETTGKISVLAEPNLVCTHGRTAEFLAGGEAPVPTSLDQNGNPVVEYKEFGVKLKFTPWIAIRSGRVELKLEPEVSRQSTTNCVQIQGLAVCPFVTRKTATTVELKDGESLMISGIIQKEEQNSFQKVPFIGNIPILGALFTNASNADGRGMSKTDTELLVVVTPRILERGDYGNLLGEAK